MKNVFCFAIALALLLVPLTGCQSGATSADQTTPPTTLQTEPAQTTPAVTEQAITLLTADEAIAIALKDAGLQKDQIRDLDAELDNDNGTPHYDVDFEKDNRDYDYEIHAETGKILSWDQERDD